MKAHWKFDLKLSGVQCYRCFLVLAFGTLVGMGGLFSLAALGRANGLHSAPWWMNWFEQPIVQLVVWTTLGWSAGGRVFRVFRVQSEEPPDGILKCVLKSAKRDKLSRVGDVAYLAWCATTGLCALAGITMVAVDQRYGVHPDFHSGIARTFLLLAFLASLALFGAFAFWIQRTEATILKNYELENKLPALVICRPPLKTESGIENDPGSAR
jgi:hypothetical protein